MGYDKVVDSAKLDSDLSLISSAILDVCGWGRPLSFPDEYVWAVNDINKNLQYYKDFNKSFSVIVSNIPKVADSLFSKCTDLITAEFPNATEIGKWAFQTCSNLESVNCPLATTISTSSFAYNSNLRDVKVPNVTVVGENAFNQCLVLKELDFHKVNVINPKAFYKCTSMTELVIRSSEPCELLDINALEQCHHFFGDYHWKYNVDSLKDGYIYVPKNLISVYQQAANWNNFVDRFRALEDYTVDGTVMGELDQRKINGE